MGTDDRDRQAAELAALVSEAQAAAGRVLDRAQLDLDLAIRPHQSSEPGSFTLAHYGEVMAAVKGIVRRAEDALATADTAGGVLILFGEQAWALGLDHAGTAPDSRTTLPRVMVEALQLAARDFGFGVVAGVQRVLADVAAVGALSRQYGNQAAEAAGLDGRRRRLADEMVKAELAGVYEDAARAAAAT